MDPPTRLGLKTQKWDQWNLKYMTQAWQATMRVEERHDTKVREELWKSKVLTIVQEFIYKLFWKKLAVVDRVATMQEVKTACPWCEARATVYHFSKTCSTTRMLVNPPPLYNHARDFIFC